MSLLRRTPSLWVLAFAFAACQAPPPAPEQEALATGELTYTLQGPALRIEQPALGAFVARTADDQIEVRGTSRARAVLIEGQRVEVDSEGRFAAKVPAVPGINILHTTAVGIAGVRGERAFLYGDYTPRRAGNESAVVSRVNAPAFKDQDGQLNDISSIVTYALSRVDLFSQLSRPFVFHYDFVVGSLDLEVLALSYDGPKSQASVEPRDGGAYTYGRFGQLGIDLGLTLELFGTHEAQGHVDVTNADFAGDIVASFSEAASVPDPLHPGSFTTEPGVVASLDNLSLGLSGISVTTNLPASSFLDQIISWIANWAQDQVAAAAAEEIEKNAANYFALALNSLALPPSFDLSSYGVAARIETSYRLDGASFDADGAAVSAAPALYWPEGSATDRAVATPGSLRVGPGGMPEMPHDATVALSLSFDLINQALYAVWGQGAIDKTVWNGGKKWGVTFDPLTLTTHLPPVLLPEADGTIRFTVGDLAAHTRVSVLGFSGNVDVNLSLTTHVALELAPEGDRLIVRLEGEPELAIDINSLLGVVPDVVINALERLIEEIAPQIASAVTVAIAVPLPSLPLDSVPGFEGHSLALAPPADLTIDPTLSRVLVSASFVLRTP